MRTTVLALAALSAAAGGCASHYSIARPDAGMLRAGVVDDPNQARRLEKALTDRDIARLLDADVRAKLPSSLSVAKLVSQCSGCRPQLVAPGAEELAAWEKAIGLLPLLDGVHPVTPMALPDGKPTLHALRTAAARMGSELLLVYLQSDNRVDNFNDAAVLYWTVLGLWTVPGETLEHWTTMQAVLLDTRTGTILGTATGDAHLKRDCPAASVNRRRDELARQASAAALSDLQAGAGKMLKQVVELALAKRRP